MNKNSFLVEITELKEMVYIRKKVKKVNCKHYRPTFHECMLCMERKDEAYYKECYLSTKQK